MINIKKGEHTLLVSKGTFESMYKPIGYVIVEEAPKKASSQNGTKATKNIEDKKISDLSKEEDNITEKETKTVKNDSDDKKEDKKEVIEKNKDKKESSLEDILGRLSKEDNKSKKK